MIFKITTIGYWQKAIIGVILIVILENAIMKRGDYLDVTRGEVVDYLNEVKKSVEEGR